MIIKAILPLEIILALEAIEWDLFLFFISSHTFLKINIDIACIQRNRIYKGN